ncbi:MAG: hypothetical protein ABH846_03815 [Patescibacteria group bacterium]
MFFIKAIKKVLGDFRGKMIFLLATLAILALFIMIPVWTTPGSDVFFHLKILDKGILVLIALLSLLNGLLVTMQLHIKRTVRKDQLKHHLTKSATAITVITSSLMATAACTACYSALFSFLGLGATIFIAKNKFWFTAIALTVTLIALYFSSKRINNECQVCTVRSR